MASPSVLSSVVIGERPIAAGSGQLCLAQKGIPAVEEGGIVRISEYDPESDRESHLRMTPRSQV